MSQSPQRGDPQRPLDGANRLVAKFARVYARASPDDEFRSEFGCGTSFKGRKVRKGEHG